MPASLYTHVITVPAATTRNGRPQHVHRTGTRKPRHEVGRDCRCYDCLYPATETMEAV